MTTKPPLSTPAKQMQCTPSLIRSRAKEKLMQMSPYGSELERKGFDSLRKLQFSKGKHLDSRFNTPIKSSQDEDLFLCARLGQILLKKNQELTQELESLKVEYLKKEETIRDLQSINISRTNVHHKLMETNKILQLETNKQHNQLMEKEEKIADLKQRLNRLVNFSSSLKENDHIALHFNPAASLQTPCVQTCRSHKASPLLSSNKQPESLNSNFVSKKRSPLSFPTKSNHDDPIISSTQTQKKIKQTLSASVTKMLPHNTVTRATVGTNTTVDRIKICNASTQTSKSFDTYMDDADKIKEGQNEQLSLVDEKYVLPESQEDLELLMKMILKSLFNKKLESQFEGSVELIKGYGDNVNADSMNSMDPLKPSHSSTSDNGFFEFDFLENEKAENEVDPELQQWCV